MANGIPPELVWALLVAVIVEGFSMALLVYLMFRRQRMEEEARRMERKPSEERPEKGIEEEE